VLSWGPIFACKCDRDGGMIEASRERDGFECCTVDFEVVVDSLTIAWNLPPRRKLGEVLVFNEERRVQPEPTSRADAAFGRTTIHVVPMITIDAFA